MSYSLKFRLHVLGVCEREDLTLLATALRFAVGISTLTRWVKDPHPRPSRPRRGKIDMEVLARDIEDYPDAYQFERAKRFGVCQKAIQDWGAKGRANIIGAIVGASLLTASLFQCNINSDVFHA